MTLETLNITIKGKFVDVDAIEICGKLILIKGHLIRLAKLHEEYREDVNDPDLLINELRKSKIKIDIFSFWQRLPEIEPKFPYYKEYDNVAAVEIRSYTDWLNEITRKNRQALNRAKKKGIISRITVPDKNFINGIVSIFNETPIRQGKRFWHYGKNYNDVKKEIVEKDAQVSEFIGAYLNDELIGFIKYICMDRYMMLTQILSKVEHRDKNPTNSLLSKAVEICVERKAPYLIYGEYNYGKKGDDTLTEFKRRNGFKKICLPRYYVPITKKGKLVLKLKLHRGIESIIPKILINYIIWLRKRYSNIMKNNS